MKCILLSSYIPSGIVQGQKKIVELVNIFPYEVKIYKNQVIGVASITVSQPVNIVDARKIDLKENLQSAEERGVENKNKIEELISQIDLSIDTALTLEEQHELKEFLRRNYHVFAANPSKPSINSHVKHTIDTGEARPIKRRPKRLTHEEQEIEKVHIKQMLENGIIRKSKSPWAAPVVMVPKPDGTISFCVNYTALNSVTKPDRYPLPRIDETIDKLKGMKYLSTLDLASGFWQVAMDEKDREKTAFISTVGLPGKKFIHHFNVKII